LREIRLACWEADVNYKVAKDFYRVGQGESRGQKVWLELRPSEQVVRSFRRICGPFGGQSSRPGFYEDDSHVVMIVGLQGSGKTTRPERSPVGWRKTQDRSRCCSLRLPPAAREQLKVIAKATGQSIFEKPETNDPLELTRAALQQAATLAMNAADRSADVCTLTMS